jgi:hypothetical protein
MSHRRPGGGEPLRVALALVAERVVLGGDHQRGRESGELGAERVTAGSARSEASGSHCSTAHARSLASRPQPVPCSRTLGWESVGSMFGYASAWASGGCSSRRRRQASTATCPPALSPATITPGAVASATRTARTASSTAAGQGRSGARRYSTASTATSAASASRRHMRSCVSRSPSTHMPPCRNTTSGSGAVSGRYSRAASGGSPGSVTSSTAASAGPGGLAAARAREPSRSASGPSSRAGGPSRTSSSQAASCGSTRTR